MKANSINFFSKAVLLCLSINTMVLADLQSDVLALTGNIKAKMVWVRCASTASDFSKGPSWYSNYGTQTTLMCYDSDTKAERILDATLSQHMDPMITRSGEYVVWNANDTKKSYIAKWDGSGRKELISGGSYYVLCCQYDNATKKEYLWSTDAALSPATNVEHPYYLKVYRNELVNGVVDVSKAELMIDFKTLITQSKIWAPFTVSGDGKFGIINDHPNITVFEIASKKATGISLGGDGYGCWPSIAPDTSYRITHFNEMHTALHVFDKYNTNDAAKIRWVSIAAEMPGNFDPSGGDDFDATCPRFSNHPGFMAGSYPLIAGVSNMDYKHGEFCIGKWSKGYDAISWVRVTGINDTYRDKVGDLWLANGEGPGKFTAISVTPKNSTSSRCSITENSRGILVRFPGVNNVVARVADARGRIIAEYSGKNIRSWEISRNRVPMGSYFISIMSEDQNFTGKFIVCKK